jgi:hypothetical protein
MKKSNNSLLIAAATGLGVYYFFPQVKETLISGGGSSSGGASESADPELQNERFTEGGQSITDIGLTKKQLKFIGAQLESPADEQIKVTTFTESSGSGGSSKRITVLTSKKNIKAVESNESFKVNSGTKTTFIYKDKGSIIGGSDFGRKMSLSKKAAETAYKNRNKPSSIKTASKYQGPVRPSTDLKTFRNTGVSVSKKSLKTSKKKSSWRFW